MSNSKGLENVHLPTTAQTLKERLEFILMNKKNPYVIP